MKHGSAKGFPGFTPEAMKFLRELKKHNDREWFTPRKEIFEQQLKLPAIALVTALQAEMESFAPDYCGDPAKAVMRIYRDTRFSKDKTPYKTNVAAALRKRGLSKDGGAQIYFHISPEELMVAAGMYGPGPDELRAVRNHLLDHYAEFAKLTGTAKMRSLWGEIQGEKLSRPPKGFPAEHAAEDLLRHKQFYFSAELEPKLATSPELFDQILTRIKAAVPVLEFLNKSVGAITQKADARFLRDSHG